MTNNSFLLDSYIYSFLQDLLFLYHLSLNNILKFSITQEKYTDITKFEQAISHLKYHTAEQSQMLILSINQEAIKKFFYHIIDC